MILKFWSDSNLQSMAHTLDDLKIEFGMNPNSMEINLNDQDAADQVLFEAHMLGAIVQPTANEDDDNED